MRNFSYSKKNPKKFTLVLFDLQNFFGATFIYFLFYLLGFVMFNSFFFVCGFEKQNSQLLKWEDVLIVTYI